MEQPMEMHPKSMSCRICFPISCCPNILCTTDEEALVALKCILHNKYFLKSTSYIIPCSLQSRELAASCTPASKWSLSCSLFSYWSLSFTLFPVELEQLTRNLILSGSTLVVIKVEIHTHDRNILPFLRHFFPYLQPALVQENDQTVGVWAEL